VILAQTGRCRVTALARQEKFEPAEVRTIFTNASPAARALALGLMKGDPALADGAPRGRGGPRPSRHLTGQGTGGARPVSGAIARPQVSDRALHGERD
jgi:hypothetical protein